MNPTDSGFPKLPNLLAHHFTDKRLAEVYRRCLELNQEDLLGELIATGQDAFTIVRLAAGQPVATDVDELARILCRIEQQYAALGRLLRPDLYEEL